jgi:hypothetical protein
MRPEEFPIRCACKFRETYDEAAMRLGISLGIAQTAAWLLCPHRGPPTATVNARTAGCGCSTSTVEVYQCHRFSEPVLKKSPERCREAVAAEIPGYTGRTCRECEIPKRKLPPSSTEKEFG